VRLGLEALRRSSIEASDEGLAFRVVQLAKILRSHTRSDEHLVRIGEVTFLILVTVGRSGEIDAITSRLTRALAEATIDCASLGVSVDGPTLCGERNRSP
jgi:GGDEF domain-containing protein